MQKLRMQIAVVSSLALLFLFTESSSAFQMSSGNEEETPAVELTPAPPQDTWPGLRPLFYRWRLLDAYGVQVPRGSIIDPYNQNPLKGDFPVFGQNTFLVLTALYNPKALFTNQQNVDTQFNNDLVTAIELFHGSTVFKPKDWSLKASGKGIYNRGNQDVDDFSFLELFGELKLFDVGPNYDFTALRAGSQFFKTDFNGFIFQDFNLGAQLFGELNANRNQWALAFLDLRKKENGLLTFDRQDQQVFFANFFVQDFLRPGFNTVFSAHYNRDRRDRFFTGLNQDKLDVFYFGVAADGHFGRLEFNPAVYFAFGKDEFVFPLQEGLVQAEVDVSGYLAGVEFAYPSDYRNYRAAFFITSGDDDPFDDKAKGFAAINENINLFGGANSFIIGGAAFNKPNSFIPSNQGILSDFINPGMLLANVGLDLVLTPKLFSTSNFNYFQFMKTESAFFAPAGFFDSKSIGFEFNTQLNYRLFLNENFIIQLGGNIFFPQDGAKQLGVDDTVVTGNLTLVTLF
jgi:hypothetical protein